jgi:enoyl-CoA hydratase/carnithine racemase
MSTDLSDYQHKYANLRFERTPDGVLEVALHTAGGPFVFSEQAHRDLGSAFTDIGSDPSNQVVILTGTGESFCASFDYGSFHDAMAAGHEAYWIGLRRTGHQMLTALLDIEVPVIGVVNGPALSHSELVVMSDAVLAADHATFRDATHFVAGIPPGDGMHTIWTTLLGTNRGRYFLMTGQTLTAAEAAAYGVVAEVLPSADLMPRAHELARSWAALPELTLRGTRRILTSELRRLVQDQLHTGLTYEALADLLRTRTPGQTPRIIDLH